tara:strand:- start:64 stop:429 length:366 start_codon:yes stop_codon:yes gene_type:complete
MIYTKGDALQSLNPNAKWVIRDGTLEWLDESQTQPTDSVITAEIARLNNEEPMRLLRIQRDSKLLKTDWVVLTDSPLSTSKKTEWKTYRQSLRDLPASSSPTLDSNGNLDMSSVTFPPEPS